MFGDLKLPLSRREGTVAPISLAVVPEDYNYLEGTGYGVQVLAYSKSEDYRR
jgi:hypothetical protein